MKKNNNMKLFLNLEQCTSRPRRLLYSHTHTHTHTHTHKQTHTHTLTDGGSVCHSEAAMNYAMVVTK